MIPPSVDDLPDRRRQRRGAPALTVSDATRLRQDSSGPSRRTRIRREARLCPRQPARRLKHDAHITASGKANEAEARRTLPCIQCATASVASTTRAGQGLPIRVDVGPHRRPVEHRARDDARPRAVERGTTRCRRRCAASSRPLACCEQPETTLRPRLAWCDRGAAELRASGETLLVAIDAPGSTPRPAADR
jgi:hypothetical protein